MDCIKRVLPGGRLQFGLRSFLILVALIAVWLGSEMHTIRQRQLLRAHIKKQGGEITPATANLLPSQAQAYSTWRNWMGDEPIAYVGISMSQQTDQEVAEAERLFPEAIVGTGIRLTVWVAK